jgi:hypothetical protein
LTKKAIDYIRKSETRVKSQDRAQVIEETTVGGANKATIANAILSNLDSDTSKDVLAWLRGLTDDMAPGARMVMQTYLDLILSGEATSDAGAVELAPEVLKSTAYLGKVKAQFADTAAKLWSGEARSKNPKIQRMRDMLSDATFLDELNKGYVPGSRAAKLNQPRLLSAHDYMAELEKESKFEKGKPADPTENMSPEDAAEWERQNEAHRDQFKTAKLPSKAIPAGTRVSVKANPASRMMYSTPLPEDGTEGETVAIPLPGGKSTFMPGPGGGMIYVRFDDGTLLGVSPRDLIRSSSSPAGVDKTAAAGLYGFTKSAEKSCVGAAGKLAKYAAKLAKELYMKDADAAPFLEEHAKRGFKTAKMIRSAMADVGPGPAPKTAASKSGMGLYGFKDSTAKMAMNACSDLHLAAGHLAADLAAKFGEKQEDWANFLKKHAKAAKCAHSDLILDSYPTAPVKVGKKASFDPTVDEILAWDRAVGNRMATSFLAAEEDGELEVDTDVEADDLISSWGKTAFDMVHTAGTYQEYVERKKKKGEKPLDQNKWEARVEGQLAKGRAHPRDQKKEAPEAEGKVKRPAPGKEWPKYKGERSWEKNYRAPAQHVMGAYGLKDEDAEELTKYSRDKPHDTFQKVSPQKLMAEFLRNAKPETKERMKGMSPKDFMIMLRSMTADEPVVE